MSAKDWFNNIKKRFQKENELDEFEREYLDADFEDSAEYKRDYSSESGERTDSLAVDEEKKSFDEEIEGIDEVDPGSEAKTVRKRLVTLGGGAVICFAVGMILFNMMGSKTPKEKRQMESDSAAATVSTPADRLPEKYSQAIGGNNTPNKATTTNNRNNRNGASNGRQNRSAGNEAVRTERTGGGYYNSAPQGGGSYSATAEERAAQKALDEQAKWDYSVDSSALSFGLNQNVQPVSTGGGMSGLNGGYHKEVFDGHNDMRGMISPSMLEESDGNILYAGSVIQATLLTGITNDYPDADVVAQVRQNIYDSLTGTKLLIPQGSRLIGTVGAESGKRMGVVFDRIILPNGESIILPNQNGIDGVGFPGLEDIYKDHRGVVYRTGLLTAIFAAAAQSVTGGSSGSDYRSPGQEAVSGAVSSILNTASGLIQKDINARPTIEISPGYQFSVFINQDLLIDPYEDAY